MTDKTKLTKKELVVVSGEVKTQLDAIKAFTGQSIKNLLDEAVGEYITNRPATKAFVRDFLSLTNLA